MRSRSLRLVLTACLAISSPGLAAKRGASTRDEASDSISRVRVTEEQVEVDVTLAPYGELDGEPQLTPDLSAPGRKVRRRFPVVILENDLLRVRVAPTLGMRVIGAVDLVTGLSLDGRAEATRFEESAPADIYPWAGGFCGPSFPCARAGTGLRQPAGWRVVRGDDGSAVVAMNMRFTGFQHERHRARFGRYSQRSLSCWVVLRPGESRFSITWRLENPNLLERGNRLWSHFRLHADALDSRHVHYPVGYVVGEDLAEAVPFLAEGGFPEWEEVEVSGLFPDHGFCGVYSPERDTNSLVVLDRKRPFGLSLQTGVDARTPVGFGFGTSAAPAHPGELIDAHMPVQMTVYCYNVTGHGRVLYANKDFAIGQMPAGDPEAGDKETSEGGEKQDGGRYCLVTPHRASTRLYRWVKKYLRTTQTGPGKVHEFDPMPHFSVVVDGGDRTTLKIPLEHSDTRDRLEEIRACGGELRVEKEEFSTHVRDGVTSREAIIKADEILFEDRRPEDPKLALSIARTVFRYGHGAKALEILRLIEEGRADDPETGGDETSSSVPSERIELDEDMRADLDYLRVLIDYENESRVEFKSAGIDSYYLRAIVAWQREDREGALNWLNKLVRARPGVFRPRILKAYLAKDAGGLADLLKENPASGEVLLALELLGDEMASFQKELLLRENPEAERALAAFHDELTGGIWTHVRRFEADLPVEE